MPHVLPTPPPAGLHMSGDLGLFSQASSVMLLKAAGGVELGELLTSLVVGQQLWLLIELGDSLVKLTSVYMSRGICAHLAPTDLGLGYIFFFLFCVSACASLFQALELADGQLD